MGMNEVDVEQTLARVKGSTVKLDHLREEIDEISASRTKDIVLLRDLGVTRETIADAAGVSPARVTQLLGRVGESNRPRPAKVYVPVATGTAKAVKKVRKVLVAEAHRHHYVPIAWNHARGNFLVRQKCECGQLRVIPMVTLPKELTHQYADTSVTA